MIYDCFPFFNELDLLEMRLNTLNGVVDKFIIAEATRNHSGKAKRLNFAANRERFAAFSGKIEYVVVDDLLNEEEIAKDSYNNPWINENRQRNAILRALSGLKDDDIVIISDLDELPRPEKVVEAVALLRSGKNSVRLGMGNYGYFINFRNCFYPEWRLGTVLAKGALLTRPSILDHAKTDRYAAMSENKERTLTKLRFIKPDVYLNNGGWHFSSLGGVDMILYKLSSFAHTEFGDASREWVQGCLSRGEDVFGRGERFFAEKIEDGRFPRYLVAHRQELSKFIHPCDETYLRATRLPRLWAMFKGRIYRALVALVPEIFAPALVKLRDSILKALQRK